MIGGEGEPIEKNDIMYQDDLVYIKTRCYTFAHLKRRVGILNF